MRRLHPATIIVCIIPKLREVIQLAIPLVAGSYFSGGSHNSEWIAPAIGCFTGVFAVGAYWTTRFDIEPDHLIHTTGWLFKKDRRIPLKQVQNVSLRQNILERAFGVATVDVETAMGKGRDLKLSVLKLADAERFREEVLEAAHLDAGHAPETLQERDDTHVVTLNGHDLLLGAITENHIPQIILGLFTVGGLAIGWARRFTADQSAMIANLILLGFGILLIMGLWFWGAFNYYLKYGDFTVRRSERVFRITYGLINKVQMAVRPERIEYLHLTTTLFQRWMMRSSLHVGTASTFGEAGVLAPVALFVDTHRAYKGISEVIPGLDIPQVRWSPFHWYVYRAATLRSLMILAAAIAVGKFVGSSVTGNAPFIVWGFCGLFIFSSLFGLASMLLSIPENGYSITDVALVIRRGYFHQSISAIPIERIENIAVRQPFWWKPRKIVYLYAQAMKHHVAIGALPESSVDDLMAVWQERVRERDRKLALEFQAQSLPETPAPDEELIATTESEA